MRKLIILFLGVLPMTLFAQSLERQVIGSTGNYAASSSVQVSSTVGETVVATGLSGSIILTQGFQQPSGTMVGIDDPKTGLTINAYPNPVKNEIVVEFNTAKATQIKVGLYNMQGKGTTVTSETLEVNGNIKHVLNLSALIAGNYLLTFKSKEGFLGTIKVQKMN